MALALSLLFDGATSKAVRAVWEDLAARGISTSMVDLGYPPHATLIVVEDEALAPALDRALPDLATMGRLSLTLGPPTRFDGTDVVHLGLSGEGLAAIHEASAALVPHATIHPHYRVGHWTPHVTLQTAGHAEAALERAGALWSQPMAARTTAIELVRFSPIVTLRRLGV